MKENGLIEKKLNIFQKIRKAFYLRGMNGKKANQYYKLPDYLKQDEDVAFAVVSASKNMINNISFENAKKILKQNPKLADKLLDINKVNIFFNENPELISHYENENNLNYIYNLIYNEKLAGNREFIRYLSKDLQLKLLSNNNEYIEAQVDNTRIQGMGTVDKIKKYLKNFPEEVILDYAIREKMRIEENEKKGRSNSLKNRVLNFDIKDFSEELQLKLLFVDDNFKDKVSEDVLVKYVNGNPLLFDMFSNNFKYEMIQKNPQLLSKMSREFQFEFLRQYANRGFSKYSTIDSEFNIRDYGTPEEAIERIINTQKNRGYFDKKSITDIRDNEYIWQMGKFNPDFVELVMSSDYKDFMRNQHLVKNFYDHVANIQGNNKLTEYLGNITTNYYQSNMYRDGVEKLNRIGKIILNEDILNSISGEDILDYAENPSNEKLIKIIRTTYGDTSAKILEDRPQLDLSLIPNLHIFKPEIVQEFGIGAIHANLSYKMESSGILSELARKPELMQRYKDFNENTKGMFDDTAVGLEDKLFSFVKCKELIKNVDFNQLTDKQKESLQLAIMDSKDSKEIISFPKSLQELDDYTDKRNKLYEEAIKKQPNVKELKQLISKKFFGLNYGPVGHSAILNNPSVTEMCNFYNLEKFVNNPITLQSENFSEEELDSLEILDIFRKIKDPKVLVELSNKLSEKEEIINPLSYRKIKNKVPMQYSKEMVNSLLTPEKAMKMIEEGTPGISLEEIDEIKVIKLEGADFKTFVTNPFLYNSNVGMINANTLAKEWKEKENGIATFSGCLMDQGEITTIISKGDYGLGFSNISPYQIMGMGITDIHSSHTRRELETSTTENVAVSYDYPEEFMRRVSRRLNVEDPYGDAFHKYDEVTALRAERDLSKIKEGTFGGKILSDYVFLNGTDTTNAVNQAKSCGINFVFAYDEEKYRGKDISRRYESPKENPKREETEFMAEIKNVAKGDENDER